MSEVNKIVWLPTFFKTLFVVCSTEERKHFHFGGSCPFHFGGSCPFKNPWTNSHSQNRYI